MLLLQASELMGVEVEAGPLPERVRAAGLEEEAVEM